MKQKEQAGKVIRFFTVEISDAGSTPEQYVNPNNPYAQLSDEERLREFIEIFGLLWAESCFVAFIASCPKEKGFICYNGNYIF